jgi:hypothetical protein
MDRLWSPMAGRVHISPHQIQYFLSHTRTRALPRKAVASCRNLQFSALCCADEGQSLSSSRPAALGPSVGPVQCTPPSLTRILSTLKGESRLMSTLHPHEGRKVTGPHPHRKDLTYGLSWRPAGSGLPQVTLLTTQLTSGWWRGGYCSRLHQCTQGTAYVLPLDASQRGRQLTLSPTYNKHKY